MHNLIPKIPAWVWQILSMGLLGLSGVFFVPVLLSWADAQLMANVLVAQVFVHYFVVLVQYGFALSGPAAVASANDPVDVVQVWRSSVKGKLLLVGPIAVMFVVVCDFIGWGQLFVWVFALQLLSYALNSNWWLQAQQRFGLAVGFAALGAVTSALVLFALLQGYLGSTANSQAAWVALVMLLPQIFVGFGTWLVARRLCVGLMFSVNDNSNQKVKLPTGSAVKLNWLCADMPIVASQLLLLASTTIGTIVVGGLADPEATAAYAATEKLFNLAATVLVGLYMSFYPRLAELFYADRALYWRTKLRLLVLAVSAGLCLAALLAYEGPMLLALYLPARMVTLAAPALWPLGLWLGLCVSQHMVTSYFVLAKLKRMVLLVNASVLLLTVIAGYVFAKIMPMAWVYGMVAGQALALMLLLHTCYQDKAIGI